MGSYTLPIGFGAVSFDLNDFLSFSLISFWDFYSVRVDILLPGLSSFVCLFLGSYIAQIDLKLGM